MRGFCYFFNPMYWYTLIRIKLHLLTLYNQIIILLKERIRYKQYFAFFDNSYGLKSSDNPEKYALSRLCIFIGNAATLIYRINESIFYVLIKTSVIEDDLNIF